MSTPALRLADPAIPVLDQTIGDVVRAAAAAAPDTIALVDGVSDRDARRRWTYAELVDRAGRLAGTLLDRFRPGERIAVWTPNTPDSLVLSYAAALAGMPLVLVNPALRGPEVAHVLGQSGAAGVFLGDDYRGQALPDTLAGVRAELPALREALALDRIDDLLASAAPSPAELPRVRADDIAQIVYTSGTTGAPKGACLTHRGMTNAARFGAARFGIVPGDIYVDPLPLFHVGGQVVAFEIAQHHATMVMVGAFDPGLVLDLLEQEHATLTVGVPTMLVAMLAQPDLPARDLSALRSVSSGGAVVPAELVERVRSELGASVTIVFGLTECCGFVAQTHLDDPPEVIAQTLGTPIDGVDVRVVDPERGTVVATGEIGELQVRGNNVMAGYHEQPDETAATIDADGWLRTGDLVTLDDAGYLRIVGRLKDMIVTGGVNVYAAEVETALHAHPDVGDVAVLGLPDRRWGERVTAVICPALGHAVDPDTLDAFLRDRLAAFKVPKEWVIVEELPMTPSGKVQKFLLRERLLTDEEAAPG